MQKLDLLQILKRVSEQLRSERIFGLSTTNQNQILNGKGGAILDGRSFIDLLIESKSGYDVLLTDERAKAALNIFNASKVYATENVIHLMAELHGGTSITAAYQRPYIFQFHVFHATLQQTIKLLTQLLFSEPEILNPEPEEKGILVFQVTEFTNGTSLEQYAKIFTLLSELSEIIGKVLDPQTEFKSPQILLLDSGSSTNVGIKTTAENAKALFQVFKEIWDWTVNRRFYKNKQQGEALVDNLAILEKIHEAVSKGTITPDKAKEYSVLIQRKTDELIGLHVLPKEIALGQETRRNLLLLEQYPAMKQLSSGTNTGTAEENT